MSVPTAIQPGYLLTRAPRQSRDRIVAIKVP